MHQKPLIRWTVGSVSDCGFDCLIKSVELMKGILGCTCEYAICYNNLTKNQMDSLPKVDIVIDAESYSFLYDTLKPETRYGTAWKLYPARIRKESHEIILDNDIVLYKLPKKIINFLSSNDIVLTKSFIRSYYGVLEELVPDNFNINTGVLCLPPNYDFEKEIDYNIKKFKIKWEDHFSEQTLIAHIMSKYKCELIDTSEIFVTAEEFNLGSCGVHFVGLNKGKDEFWKKYLRQASCSLL
jgi:hypothetical protein